ncbi:MAG TPA: hypothetical protein VKU38_20640 [Ktedonobacteraceae bacterium]|nr:hypothetical protein [Ktedonobacteraceae bacterium]
MRIQLYSIQEELPTGKLSIMARPRGGDWLRDEITSLHQAGVDVLVSLLTFLEVSEFALAEEESLCRQHGITCYSFPILDYSVPPLSAQTGAFIEQLASHLSAGKHVTLHCRQGFGRAPLIAACILILNDFTPDQAFTLLSKVRGYPVPETAEQREWAVAFSHDRNSI